MFPKENLIKTYVFLGIDILSLFIATVLSNLIRFGTFQLFDYDNLYIHVLIWAVVACVAGNRMFRLDQHIFDRGLYAELISVIKSCVCVGMVILTYLFMTQEGIHYSRIQLVYFMIIYGVFSYLGHLLAKPAIGTYYKNSRSCNQIMLITSSDKVDDILEQFKMTNNWYFNLSYITIVDCDMKGQEIQGIPVIATVDDMLQASRDIILDGVFINVSPKAQRNFDVRSTLHSFQQLGIAVHVNIDALELDVTNKTIEKLGFFRVVSYKNKMSDPGQLILKRCMDVAGGIIGLIITTIVGIFLVPIIKLESPGPAIYKQTRVGKNGRHFQMYKFRSMYQDADKRKAELMDKNEMKGAMFKIADDPRITRVGKFIRKYSIDELPQFWNVLKGDMSLVGTRPPTVDEVEKYAIEQKQRLSVTPGMTGLWQTSGRNAIYDFDQIVKLDLQYIDEWSIGLDIKLLCKTIAVCFKGDGAE